MAAEAPSVEGLRLVRRHPSGMRLTGIETLLAQSVGGGGGREGRREEAQNSQRREISPDESEIKGGERLSPTERQRERERAPSFAQECKNTFIRRSWSEILNGCRRHSVLLRHV